MNPICIIIRHDGKCKFKVLLRAILTPAHALAVQLKHLKFSSKRSNIDMLSKPFDFNISWHDGIYRTKDFLSATTFRLISHT